MANEYATNAQCVAQIFEGGTSPTPAQSAIIDIVREAASRQIDNVCARQFYASTGSRVFRPINGSFCSIDDTATITQVATDMDGDQVYETVWATTDFQTEGVNAVAKGWPITGLRAVRTKYFPAAAIGGVIQSAGTFMSAPEFFVGGLGYSVNRTSVQITGTFGWPAIPAAILQATIIQAGMLYKATVAPFGVAGSQDLGQLRITSQLHPTARSLVSPYRRDGGGLGGYA